MQLIVTRNSLKIALENPVDEAFFEEVLGLKKAGDYTMAVRVGVMGAPQAWAYLGIEPRVKITTGITGFLDPTSAQTEAPYPDHSPAKAEPESPTSNPPTQNEPASNSALKSR